MTTSKPNPVFRLMPSLTDVAFLLPVLFLFTRMDGVRTLLSDGDTGWHIRTGEWILAHHSVPHTDIFSYTRPGQPWFAWEWLWDVGAAWLHLRWGLGGVALASLVVLGFTFVLLYRLTYRRSGNAMVAIAITMVAAAGSTMHWLARPHLITWLFVAIFLTLLQGVREGRTRLLWWLPVLTIPWANLHAGFPAAILILAAYAGGELARALVAETRAERRAAAKSSLPYMAAAAGSLAASLINPYTYHLHQHIWDYLHNPFIQHIDEFQSANFQMPMAGFFEAMLALGLGAAIWSGLRKDFSDALLWAGWAHLALLAGRNVPIFMIVAAPSAAAGVVAAIERLSRAPLAWWVRKSGETAISAGEEMAPFERMWRTHAVSAAVLAVIGLGMAASGAGKMLKPEFDPKRYPVGALEVLNRPAQRIFAPDQWGDYLIYKLSPNGTKVYFDGRSDFYGEKFDNEYLDVMNVKYDWEQTLARYEVDTILLSPDAPLASTLKESSRWRVVFDDSSAIVFRPRSASGEQVSTSSTGGKTRDLSITGPSAVVSEDRVTKKEVKPL
jgi:hypothetical protein